MDSIISKPHISWLILVYDRKAENRFPFKRKWHVFSYDRASDRDAEEVIRLCCGEESFASQIEKPKMGETQITYSIGFSYTNRSILQYRHLFDYVPDLENASDHSNEQYIACRSVNLPPDSYFEDENQEPISMMQIMDEEAKLENGSTAAIVMDIPKSILRSGPSSPIRKDLWKKADWDIYTLFLKIYHFIHRSRWYVSPCMVSSIPNDIKHTQMPLSEDCMAIIIPFRQLYSNNQSDNLFNKICNIHSRHCSQEHPTYMWVKEYQKVFNRSLDDKVHFIPACGINTQNCDINNRSYLDAFAYGAKIVHVQHQKEKTAQDFRYLQDNFKIEHMVMQYHMILHALMRPMGMVVEILKQDFNHWAEKHGFEKTGDTIGMDIFNVNKKIEDE